MRLVLFEHLADVSFMKARSTEGLGHLKRFGRLFLTAQVAGETNHRRSKYFLAARKPP
jgi:hypothetical protein